MTTRIVMLLDMSGSMSGLEKDVIGGFNSFISEQKKLKGKATVTTVVFDTEYEFIHDNVNLLEVQPITNKEYYPRGMTALLDALGKTILLMDTVKTKKDKVLVVINTDGQENSSKEFNNEKIKKLVEEREKQGWDFVFLGANIDAFDVAEQWSIHNVSNYTSSGEGIAAMYSTVGDVTSSYRTTGTVSTTALDDLNKTTKTAP